MLSRSLLFFVSLGAALVFPREAYGQEARLDYVQARTDHRLLGTLRGLGIELGLALRPRIGVRLGYEIDRHEYQDVASTCSGLISPDVDCGPEPSAERASMDAITLAIPIALVTFRRAQLEVAPGVRLTSLAHSRHGLDSGGTLAADKSMWAAEIGAAAVVAPVPSWPVRFHAGWKRAVLRPMQHEIVLDGYTPFEEGIAATMWEVGASVDLKNMF